MFFLLYKRTDNVVFDDFPKISDHFPKISEYFPKLSRRPDERSRTFSENFRKCPKMSKDVRRLPKTFEEDPKMFRWFTNEFKYNLRDKPDVTEIIDIFTCEDIVSFLSIWYHSLYHWLLSGAIIGDGDRKRAPFIVLGLAPWYGTIFLFLEQIAPSPAAHACTLLRGFSRMSRRGNGVRNSRNGLCFWPTTQRLYGCWNFD